jgi:hypothetical protein
MACNSARMASKGGRSLGKRLKHLERQIKDSWRLLCISCMCLCILCWHAGHLVSDAWHFMVLRLTALAQTCWAGCAMQQGGKWQLQHHGQPRKPSAAAVCCLSAAVHHMPALTPCTQHDIVLGCICGELAEACIGDVPSVSLDPGGHAPVHLPHLNLQAVIACVVVAPQPGSQWSGSASGHVSTSSPDQQVANMGAM